MATIAIGDIHGNIAALRDLLTQVRAEAARGDSVVFLGDYIDRGPDSRACIDAILSFRSECEAHVVCLKGNHEDWLLKAEANHFHHSWLLAMDAFPTIRSYSPEAERTLRDALRQLGGDAYGERAPLPYDVFFDTLPPSHREFFDGLSLYFEGPDCVCSHAGLDSRVESLDAQSPRTFIWGRWSFPDDYAGEPPVVYGHYNDPELDAAGWPTPRIVGNTCGIDTISYGVLTAIRMPDRRVFQSARYPAMESAT
jgi:serine/threonine protein phosphatase 1